MTYAEYAAIPGLTWSRLSLMMESPRHARWRATHPREDTPELMLLREIHSLALEGRSEAVVWLGDRRAGKAWDAFRSAHPGRPILRAPEAVRAVETARAIHEHPVAGPILASPTGRPEVSLVWGACKGRLDWLDPEAGVIADLKTLGTTDERAVMRAVVHRGYHAQLAHYREGAIHHGARIRRVYLIVAEGSGAQDVAVYDLDDATLDAGLRLRDRLMARWQECERTGHWPGRHDDGPVPFSVPEWADEVTNG